MGALLALVLLTGTPDDAFRFTATLDGAGSTAEIAGFGAGLELAWYPLAYVRLQVSASQMWMWRFGRNTQEIGAVKVLAGVDGVLPFKWGEAFMGIASGVANSNAEPLPPPCSGCLQRYEPDYELQATMRARAGLEVTLARPFIFGLDVGYSFFDRRERPVHWADVHARVGFAF